MTQAILFLVVFLIVNSQGQESKSLRCSVERWTWSWIEFKGSFHTCKIENQAIDQEGFVFSRSASVESFSIKDNKDVKFIPEKLAEKFPELIASQVWNCSVRQVRRSHFKGLNELKFLALGHNEITDIESESFDDLHRLEDLRLGFNKLSHLHRNLFNPLVNLKALYLHDNQIEFMSPTIFSSLVNVQYIALHRSKIGSLASNQFENMVNLKNLSLTGNNLEVIDDNLLKTNRRLENIWINDNKLVFISSETFYGLENLKYLDLFGNQCINKFWRSPSRNDLKNALAEKCSKLFENNFLTFKSKLIEQHRREMDDLRENLNSKINQCQKNLEACSCE